MTAISTLCVVLRFVQRLSIGVSWDDWCILASLVFAYGCLTTVLVATIVRAGYHIEGYTVSELDTYMKVKALPRSQDMSRSKVANWSPLLSLQVGTRQ